MFTIDNIDYLESLGGLMKGLLVLVGLIVLFWIFTLTSLVIVEVFIMNYITISALRTILGLLIYALSVAVWYLVSVFVARHYLKKSSTPHSNN